MFTFCRNKSGLWGWRSDKVESINGYDCKVSQHHLVMKTNTHV